MVPSLMILALRDDTSRHDVCRSLYWRSKARLPTGHASRPTRQGTCPIMVLRARVDAGCSQRAGPPGQLTARRGQTPGGYRCGRPRWPRCARVRGKATLGGPLKLLGCAVRLVMRPLHLAAPPRPMALDLHPQRDAQEGADENNEPKDREVLDRGRDRDRADDIGGNQKL